MVISAVGGFRRGLVLSAFSLVGLAVGAYVGARVAPHLVHGGSNSKWTPVAALVGAVLGAVLLQFGALVAGSFIRGGMRFTPLRLIDSAGGLLLGGAIGLAIVWVGASVALLTPGRTAFRRQVERSAIVKQLDSALPPRTLLNLLARIDPFPSIVGPKAPTLPPSKGVLRDPSIRAATTRIVKVARDGVRRRRRGQRLARGAGPHRDRCARRRRRERHRGADPRRRASVPRRQPSSCSTPTTMSPCCVSPELDARPLPLADPQPGAAVAILGYPLDGGLTATPGRIGRTATVLTQDALGHGPVARTITAVPGGSARRLRRAGGRRGGAGRVDDLRPASRLGERLRRSAARSSAAISRAPARMASPTGDLRALDGSGNSSTTSSGWRNGATT